MYFPLPLSFKINVMGFKRNFSGFFLISTETLKKRAMVTMQKYPS